MEIAKPNLKWAEFNVSYGIMPVEPTIRSFFDTLVAGQIDKKGDYYCVHFDHRSHKFYAISKDDEEDVRKLGHPLEEGETSVFNGESVRAMTYEEEKSYNEDNLMLLVDLWGNVCADDKENAEWSKWYHDHY